jgi:hypothetical protein
MAFKYPQAPKALPVIERLTHEGKSQSEIAEELNHLMKKDAEGYTFGSKEWDGGKVSVFLHKNRRVSRTRTKSEQLVMDFDVPAQIRPEPTAEIYVFVAVPQTKLPKVMEALK